MNLPQVRKIRQYCIPTQSRRALAQLPDLPRDLVEILQQQTRPRRHHLGEIRLRQQVSQSHHRHRHVRHARRHAHHIRHLHVPDPRFHPRHEREQIHQFLPHLVLVQVELARHRCHAKPQLPTVVPPDVFGDVRPRSLLGDDIPEFVHQVFLPLRSVPTDAPTPVAQLGQRVDGILRRLASVFPRRARRPPHRPKLQRRGGLDLGRHAARRP